MVRAAIVALALTPSFAEEDVYYHTQLLQTKMNPQKVAVGADGDVKDDIALFQKTFKISKKTAHDKFMAVLMKAKKSHRGRPGERGPPPPGGDSKEGGRGPPPPQGPPEGGRGPPEGGRGPPPPPPSDSPFGPPPPEAAQECKIYYGDDTDVSKCWTCSMTAFMSCDESSFHPDPNKGMRDVCDNIDDCMGETNSLTEKCEGEYGPEVGLMDCLMCGMMCECESPDECDLQCHRGCMAMDDEHWEEEKDWDTQEFEEETDKGGEHDECYHHCKAFYGEDADYDKCMYAGETCVPKANEVTPMSEQAWFDEMVGCCDEVMGEKNAVTKICQEHYGEDVEVFDCFACGMACGCEPGKAEECDAECHYSCMTEDWLNQDFSSSSWSDSSWSDSSWSDSSWSSFLSMANNSSAVLLANNSSSSSWSTVLLANNSSSSSWTSTVLLGQNPNSSWTSSSWPDWSGSSSWSWNGSSSWPDWNGSSWSYNGSSWSFNGSSWSSSDYSWPTYASTYGSNGSSSDWSSGDWTTSSYWLLLKKTQQQAAVLKALGDKMKAIKLTGDSTDLMQISKHLKK